MNRIIAAIVLLSGVCLAADEYAITVPATNSTVIIPRAGQPKTYTTWTASTAYTNGQYVQAPGSQRYYMCLVAGTTSTTAPTAVFGTFTNGTATFIAVPKGGRQKVLVTQEASAQIWYHTGATATTNGGEYAYVKGQQYSTESADSISVYTDSDVKLNIVEK
jgi:hypothetical protein